MLSVAGCLAALKGSTALSQAVVAGGAFAGFMYSSFKRHPDDNDKSLIDYALALILTPMLLLGITAGMLCKVLAVVLAQSDHESQLSYPVVDACKIRVQGCHHCICSICSCPTSFAVHSA